MSHKLFTPTSSSFSREYFRGIPEIIKKVEEILTLCGTSDKNQLLEVDYRAHKLREHLIFLIQTYYKTQNSYDFSDYESRLLLSDREIDINIQQKICYEHEKLTPIGKSFHEYCYTNLHNLSDEAQQLLSTKIIKELALADLIYEYNGPLGQSLGKIEEIHFHNSEQFLYDIKNAVDSGVIGGDLSHDSLYKKVDARSCISLVQGAGASGIRSLNLSHNYIYKIFDAKSCISLVQAAGASGIRSMNISDNTLSEKLDARDYISLVQAAGASGIRSLDIAYNYLSEKLDAKDYISLVQAAGASGIRSLDIGWNNLHLKLDIHAFMGLIETAGASGIRILNLSGHNISHNLQPCIKEDLDVIMRTCNICVDYSH